MFFTRRDQPKKDGGDGGTQDPSMDPMKDPELGKYGKDPNLPVPGEDEAIAKKDL